MVKTWPLIQYASRHWVYRRRGLTRHTVFRREDMSPVKSDPAQVERIRLLLGSKVREAGLWTTELLGLEIAEDCISGLVIDLESQRFLPAEIDNAVLRLERIGIPLILRRSRRLDGDPRPTFSEWMENSQQQKTCPTLPPCVDLVAEDLHVMKMLLNGGVRSLRCIFLGFPAFLHTHRQIALESDCDPMKMRCLELAFGGIVMGHASPLDVVVSALELFPKKPTARRKFLTRRK